MIRIDPDQSVLPQPTPDSFAHAVADHLERRAEDHARSGIVTAGATLRSLSVYVRD